MGESCSDKSLGYAPASAGGQWPIFPWAERILTGPKRSNGKKLLSPFLLGAIERRNILGISAHPNCVLSRVFHEAQNLLDLARNPIRSQGGSARKRIEADGFRFCAGGELIFDPAFVINPPTGIHTFVAESLTPGRRSGNAEVKLKRQRLRDNLLRAVRGLIEAPFNLVKLRQAEIAAIISRLVDLDKAGLEAVMALADYELSDAVEAAGSTPDPACKQAYSVQADDAKVIILAIKTELSKRANTKPSAV